MNISALPHLAAKAAASNKKLFQRLKRINRKHLNEVAGGLHEQVFSGINCLDCANCCKTISPVFKEKDIERISRHLRLRPGAFAEKYLLTDEDGDYVVKSLPCPFLGPENRCGIYEQRPLSCRDYPHTGTGRFEKHFRITMENTFVCPAVYEIVEKLKAVFSNSGKDLQGSLKE